MARARSPNYPQIGLSSALDLTRRLWSASGKSAVSKAEIAAAWSYKGVSGPVRARIGALRHYGLMAKEKGGLKLSGLAVVLMAHPEDSSEYQEALRRAGSNPTFFKTILKTRPTAKDNTLRAYLIANEGFSERGAKQFIEAYRDTVKIAQLDSSEYNYSEDDSNDDMSTKHSFLPPSLAQKSPPPLPGMKEDTYTLDEGRVVLQWPKQLSPESYEQFIDWLQLIQKTAKRSIVENEQDDNPE